MDMQTYTYLTKDQRVAKIATEIVGYGDSSPQAQLSLMRELILELLPHISHGSADYMRLMSVCCHTPAENVNAWLMKLMHVYLQIPAVNESFASMSAEDQAASY
jgi:hypothetical protein